MFYKDAKVYSDGSHYIAIPHTSNPCKRKRVIETPVEVPDEAQTINVSGTEPETQEIMSQEIKDEWDFSDMTPVESNDMPFDVEPPKPKKKYVKRSEVFEKLYAESTGGELFCAAGYQLPWTGTRREPRRMGREPANLHGRSRRI